MDREKVIKGLERCKLYNKVNCDKCPYDYNGRGNGKSECTAELATDVLALLKEQEAEISRVSNEYLALVGKASKKPEIVRCKDCKHGRLYEQDLVDCELQELAKEADWFCADGERKCSELPNSSVGS